MQEGAGRGGRGGGGAGGEVEAVCSAKTLFGRLGLEEEDTEPADVRKAYKSLALKVHPDKSKHAQATEAFKLLSEAFECLYDREQQNLYLTSLQVPEPEPPKQWGKNKKKRPREKKKQRKSWWEGKPWEEVELELRRREEEERSMREGFVARQRALFAGRQLTSSVFKCQQVCEELDRRRGVEDSPLWFRPPPEIAEGEEPPEEEQQEEDPATQLGRLLGHLREEHVYCFYCGTHYDSKVDLDEHCPGPNEEDH